MTIFAVKNYTIDYKTDLDEYYLFRLPKNAEKLNRIEKDVMLTKKKLFVEKTI